MVVKVKVSEIKPNPFHARRHFDKEAIAGLAEEIKTTGLWSGALRGRKHNGHVELCFGHRRLEAIKKLGWKEVEIDIVELDDDQMAIQSLIENLQREGLNDIEKAEGVSQLVARQKIIPGYNHNSAIKAVSAALGYSIQAIYKFLEIANLDDESKESVRKGIIVGGTALRAHQIGGTEFVKTAAEKKMTRAVVETIGQKIAEIQDQKVREKVKERVVKGELTIPDQIQNTARRMTARKAGEPPPDLNVVIVNWTGFIRGWIKELEEVRPYMDYIDRIPVIAESFRKVVRELIAELQKFL